MAVNSRATTTQRYRPIAAGFKASGGTAALVMVRSSRALGRPVLQRLGGLRDAADLVQVAEGDAGRLSGLDVVDTAGRARGDELAALQRPAARGHRVHEEGEGGWGPSRQRRRGAAAHQLAVDP